MFLFSHHVDIRISYERVLTPWIISNRDRIRFGDQVIV
jgi:hypothetical protein